MSNPRVLVTGASGYVGSELIPYLVAEGFDVRAFSRSPLQVAVPTSYGDAVSGEGLDDALSGIDVVYYLIHSMERTTGDSDFVELERRAATNFAAACQRQGVQRVVYLGGVMPAQSQAPSPHLASRLQVEQTLLAAVPNSVALRASIVIGAGSRSFQFLVHLIERLPLLVLPPWQHFQTQPVDIRDVVRYLALAATSEDAAGKTVDIFGPDRVSYGELMRRIAELMLIDRMAISLPTGLGLLEATVAAGIASEDPGLVIPLMGSLKGDLLPQSNLAEQLFELTPHTLDRAIEHALYRWEQTKQLAAR